MSISSLCKHISGCSALMIGPNTESVSIGRRTVTDVHIVFVVDAMSEPNYACETCTFVGLFVN